MFETSLPFVLYSLQFFAGCTFSFVFASIEPDSSSTSVMDNALFVSLIPLVVELVAPIGVEYRPKTDMKGVNLSV
ncbi:hypothetical protein D3C87_1558810 [compost metagenome]